jgi:predicted phage tail protein
VARKASKLDRMLTPVTHDDLHEWTRRLDAVVDKFADATANLSVTIARHAQRLDNGEKLIQMVQDDTHRLEAKMDANQKDYVARLDAQTLTVKQHFDETVKPLAAKVNSLNRLRWMVLGGSAVVMAVVAIVAFVLEILAK